MYLDDDGSLDISHGSFEPLVLAAAVLALGIYVPIPALSCMIAALVMAGLGIGLLALRMKVPLLWGALAFSCAAGSGIASFLAMAQVEHRASAFFGLPSATVANVEAVLITRSPGSKGDQVLKLELESCADANGARARARGNLTVMGVKPEPLWPPGARLALHGTIKPDRLGEGYIMYAKTISMAEPPPFLENLRNRAFSALVTAVGRSGNESSQLMEALLLGDRNGLDAGLSDLFKRAGCSHILALSGQNLASLVALILVLSKKTLGSSKALLFSCVVVCIYTDIVGADSSVLRSAFMFILLAFGRIRGRPMGARNALSIAFIATTVLDPASSHGWSFILSYLAMAGLVFLGPKIDYALRPWIPSPISGTLSASIAAFIATAPFGIYNFDTLRPVGILSSALTGPLVAALLWIGAVGAMLIAVIPALSLPVSFLADLVYRVLIAVLNAATMVPGIVLPSDGARGIVLVVVVSLSCLVYAWPHVGYCIYRNGARNRL